MANPNEFSQPVSFLNGGPFETTWGPYATKELACQALKNEVDADGRNMRMGKTVAIGTVTNYVEHAWQGGFEDINLKKIIAIDPEFINSVLPNNFAPIDGFTVVNGKRWAYTTNAAVTDTYNYGYFVPNFLKDYYITSANQAEVVYMVIYQDANGAIIGFEKKGTGVMDVVLNFKLTIPASTTNVIINCKQGYALSVSSLRYSVSSKEELKTVSDNVITVEANANSALSKVVDVEKILTEKVAIALAETENFYWAASTNEPVANTSYKYSIIDSLPTFGTYYITSQIGGTAVYMILYLNSSGTKIGQQEQGTGSFLEKVDVPLIIPVGTSRIIVNGRKGYRLIVKKEQKVTSIPTKTEVANVESKADTAVTGTQANAASIGEIKNRLSEYTPVALVKQPGRWSASTNAPVVDAGYNYVMLPAPSTGTLLVTVAIGGTPVWVATYLRADGTKIGQQEQGTGVLVQRTDLALVIPSGTVTIVINGSINSSYAFIIKALAPIQVASKEDITLVNSRIDNLKIASHWKDKKIVWFGTSIPATGYPLIVGSILGANVVNEAVPSSGARRGKKETTAEDPYGWFGLAYQNVTRNLAQTLAEKQDLIDNWAYWRTKFTDSANVPLTLSEADKANFIDWSYEKRLVERHIGPGKRADLYVFDHGHNDNYTYLPGYTPDMDIVPANSRDRNYFIGAMNFLIDIILKDNPRARICFIGHYENSKPSKQIITIGQKKLAEYWNFPLLQLWEKTGWTQQTVATTGYWVDNLTWVEYGGPEQTLTLTQIWMQDDLHPRSLPAQELLASIIAPFVENVK